MTKTTQIIESIKENPKYEEKTQMIAVMLSSLHQRKIKLTKQEKEELSTFISKEMEQIVSTVETIESYKTKSQIFSYADVLFGLILAIYKHPTELSPEKLSTLQNVSVLLDKEMYLERYVDNMFTQEIISVTDVETLLNMLSETKDEYEKGLFYSGLLHYRDKVNKFLESSKASIASYMARELDRYIREYDIADEDKTNAFEAACDACLYFINDEIAALLYEVLKLGNNALSYFAFATLFKAKREVPEETVTILAKDLIYAESVYRLLCSQGKEELFPKELINDEYLAKSDLVHWLTFPTELGKAPDKIEYIGKTEVKKEVFHIFRFMSDSNTLSEEQKNKWLIGWSSNEGGTFSNFDEYEKFEQKTTEKTLKYIKKKIL